ncbi:response regulator [Lysinibacillus antri]|uniref:Response regulator n=1 Tax=Lysinibacillus antri TaxID=2498145 RepID=A0A3S0R7J5_9BACI|nr:response regulator [Lysinibacillus antri]RUL55090.1 response regulator [Lysinibacillus antri]
MLKAVIVDDELLVANFLKMQLESTGLVTVIGQFQKPTCALKEIPTLKPDVVFLDIEMSGMNGIELGTKLLTKCPTLEIIFVTAYNQYAVDAFKLNAIHYLLKPANDNELQEALERVIEKKNYQLIVKVSEDIRIELIGHIRILQNHNEVRLKWSTVKVEELFALMILHRKNGIEKWQIIEKLWPSLEMKKAEQNLYTTIYRLKKNLLESGIHIKIENVKGKYFLELPNCTIDLDEYDYIDKSVLFGDKQYAWVDTLTI